MHILIVEDEPAIRQELKQLLENSLYQVTVLEEARTEAMEDFCLAGTKVCADADIVERIVQINPDLVLLDVNLPGESGFDICQRLRGVSDVPVIFVTSRTDSMDELNGMLKGGDDYITKPFNPPVLLAHIAAVLKRTRRNKDRNQGQNQVRSQDKGEVAGVTRFRHKDVELDVAGGFASYRGKRAELSKNELKIMYYLFCHRGEIVPRLDLVEYLWDNQVFIDDNALSVNMTRLRGKLEEIGICGFIETKRGMGYRILRFFDL